MGFLQQQIREYAEKMRAATMGQNTQNKNIEAPFFITMNVLLRELKQADTVAYMESIAHAIDSVQRLREKHFTALQNDGFMGGLGIGGIGACPHAATHDPQGYRGDGV